MVLKIDRRTREKLDYILNVVDYVSAVKEGLLFTFTRDGFLKVMYYSVTLSEKNTAKFGYDTDLKEFILINCITADVEKRIRRGFSKMKKMIRKEPETLIGFRDGWETIIENKIKGE